MTLEHFCLRDLVDTITPENCHPETDWGCAVGQEKLDTEFISRCRLLQALMLAACLSFPSEAVSQNTNGKYRSAQQKQRAIPEPPMNEPITVLIAKFGAQPPVAINGALVELESDGNADVQTLRIRENSIDGLVLGKDMSIESSERYLRKSLARHIDRIQAICALTPEQLQTLHFAGNAQIQQFLDRAEEMKRPLRRIRFEIVGTKAIAPQAFEQIIPKQIFLDLVTGEGPFGSRSLFDKVLRNTLNDEQAAEFY